MTIAVLDACKVIDPNSFFLSSSRKNWYFVPSAYTPLAINVEKSLLLKHFAIFADSSCVTWGKKETKDYFHTNKMMWSQPRFSPKHAFDEE